MKRSTKSLIKWTIYSVLLLLLMTIQSTPGLFEIKGTKPALVVPLAVFVAVFEGEVGGFAFAVATGILWDQASDKIFGFSPIILASCCVIVALLTIFLIRATILNCCVLCLAVMIIYSFFDFLFYYAIWGYGDIVSVVIKHFVSMTIYTTAVSPLVFLIVKKIASRYNEILRV